MRRRWRFRKIANGIAWLVIVYLGCNILMRAFELPAGEYIMTSLEKVMGHIEQQIGALMYHTYSPTITYLEHAHRDSETLAEKLLNVVEEALPMRTFLRQKEEPLKNWNDPAYLKNLKNKEMTEMLTESDTESMTVLESTEAAPTESSLETTEAVLENTEEITEEVLQVDSDIFHPKVVGTEYSVAKLSDYDFLVRNFYAVSEITTINSKELNAETLLSKNMSLTSGNDTPQILIYHTHSQEDFVDSVAGDDSTLIIGVGEYLKQILTEQYGYQVIHDTTPYDMHNGVMDRDKAYTYALEGITPILEANPSIEVVIDLHRDGVNEGVHLVTEVNGKPTAQIMFVNGISRTTWQGEIDYLYNPYIEDNLAFSLQLQLRAKAYYPDFTRRIMIKAYRYNMHVRPKSLLVEAGAQTNTLQEVKNAMEPLAVMLHEILK